MTPIPDLELAPFGVRTPVKTAFVKDIIRALGETIWVPEGLTLPEATIRAEAAFTAWAAFAPSDPVEMMLAAEAVGAHNAAMECLRRAMMPEVEPQVTERLRSNAASMSRMVRDTMKALAAYRALPAQTPMRRETVPTPADPVVAPEEAPAGAVVAEPAQMSMQREATPIEATAEAAGPTQSWQVRKARIVATAPIRAFWAHDHAPDCDMLAAWKEAVRQGTALIDAEDAAEALAT